MKDPGLIDRDLSDRLLDRLTINLTPPETLYHYTSGASLLEILATRSLRMTDVRYLSDSAELVYTTTLAEEYLLKTEKDFTGSAGRELLARSRAAIEEILGESIYVACFSEKSDRLSQWRAYASPSGMCLGFSTGQLLKACNSFGGRVLMAKCIYDRGSQENEVEHVIAGLRKTYLQLLSENAADTKMLFVGYEALIGTHLALLAASIKHPGFHEEAEWRFVAKGDPPDIEQQFRMSKSLIVPYVSLQLPSEDILDSVILGPTPHPLQAERAVRRLLDKEGLKNTKTALSAIPYRDW